MRKFFVCDLLFLPVLSTSFSDREVWKGSARGVKGVRRMGVIGKVWIGGPRRPVCGVQQPRCRIFVGTQGNLSPTAFRIASSVNGLLFSSAVIHFYHRPQGLEQKGTRRANRLGAVGILNPDRIRHANHACDCYTSRAWRDFWRRSPWNVRRQRSARPAVVRWHETRSAAEAPRSLRGRSPAGRKNKPNSPAGTSPR